MMRSEVMHVLSTHEQHVNSQRGNVNQQSGTRNRFEDGGIQKEVTPQSSSVRSIENESVYIRKLW